MIWHWTTDPRYMLRRAFRVLFEEASDENFLLVTDSLIKRGLIRRPPLEKLETEKCPMCHGAGRIFL